MPLLGIDLGGDQEVKSPPHTVMHKDDKDGNFNFPAGMESKVEFGTEKGDDDE